MSVSLTKYRLHKLLILGMIKLQVNDQKSQMVYRLKMQLEKFIAAQNSATD